MQGLVSLWLDFLYIFLGSSVWIPFYQLFVLLSLSLLFNCYTIPTKVHTLKSYSSSIAPTDLVEQIYTNVQYEVIRRFASHRHRASTASHCRIHLLDAMSFRGLQQGFHGEL